DTRVVEAGGDAVRLDHLAVVVLEDVAARAVEHAHRARVERGGVPAALAALAGGPAPEGPDLRVGREPAEEPHRVRAAADARHGRFGELAGAREDLRLGLAADHGLKVTHHGRIRVGTGDRADAVIRGADVGDPV